MCIRDRCSDGLTDNLSTKEIIEVVRKGPLAAAAEALQARALARMSASTPPNKPDDLTLLLYRPKA